MQNDKRTMDEQQDAESGHEDTTRTESKRKALLRILLVVCLLAFLCMVPKARAWLTTERIRQLTASLGVMGPIGLILIGAVGPLFFIPRAPLCLVSGLLYGIAMGTVVGVAAGTTGCVVQYFLAMGVLSRAATRLTPKHWQQPLSAVRTRPFSTILLFRLFPLSNSSIVNMMAGLLRVPFLPYLSATILGTLPITIMYALWGKTAKQPSKTYVVISVLLLLVLTLAGLLVRRTHWFRRS